MSNFRDRIVLFLKDSKILSPIVSPIYRKINHYVSKRRNARAKRLFEVYGLEALKAFDECLTMNGYPYTLMAGTLLGAVREKGFIKHDIDIDVAMWYKHFDPALYEKLAEYGFKRKYSYSVDKDTLGKEDSFLYKGVNIDIFYIYDSISDYPYLCDFINHPNYRGIGGYKECAQECGGLLPRRVEAPFSDSYVRIPFENVAFPVMENADDFLRFRYGDDYMIPNPNWSMRGQNPHIIEWVDKLGAFEVL